MSLIGRLNFSSTKIFIPCPIAEFLTAFANAYLLSKSRPAKFIATKRNWLQQSSVQIKDPYQLLS